MSFVAKIQEAASSLTRSERRLVQLVVESPRDAALGTVTELARGAGVHEATVSRLVRKLGFESYATFRLALQQEFIPSQETARRFEKTIDQTSESQILAILIRQEADAILRIENYVSPERITMVAEKLMAARRIFLFGRGNAETLSLMMLKRFRRFGCDVHQLSGDPRDLAEQALGFGAGDIVLGFVFRRAPRGYGPLMESARESGAETIVISGTAGTMLVPGPDTLLAVPRSGEPDAFQTLTVPMTICNAIVLAAGALRKAESLRTLDRLGELIKRFA